MGGPAGALVAAAAGGLMPAPTGALVTGSAVGKGTSGPAVDRAGDPVGARGGDAPDPGPPVTA
jgi:hypothetical protein